MLAPALLMQAFVQKGRPETVSVVLTTRRPGHDSGVTVATAVEIDLDDPSWQGRLTEAVTRQARSAASALRDQLLAQQGEHPPDFVPFAAVVPTTAPDPSRVS
jgi:hypothetical protein